MGKVKSVFSNVFAWIKSHVKIVVAVVAVLVVAIVAVNLLGGVGNSGVKKYLNALNSCKDEKI